MTTVADYAEKKNKRENCNRASTRERKKTEIIKSLYAVDSVGTVDNHTQNERQRGTKGLFFISEFVISTLNLRGIRCE